MLVALSKNAVPATGDHFPLLLVIAGLVIAVGLFAALLILRARAKKRAEAEKDGRS